MHYRPRSDGFFESCLISQSQRMDLENVEQCPWPLNIKTYHDNFSLCAEEIHKMSIGGQTLFGQTAVHISEEDARKVLEKYGFKKTEA